MADANDNIGLAGEYVIGTLDAAERAQVTGARMHDATLNAEIESWEQKFYPLTASILPVTPSPDLWRRIEAGISGAVIDLRKHMERRMRLWRGMALAASFAAVLTAGFSVYVLQHFANAPGLEAFLQTNPAAPAFMVSLNDRDNSITIDLHGDLPADKSYELWLITDDKTPPHPMGIVTANKTTLHPDLSHMSAELVRSATVAISVEPVGGSPTGLPTGPVISTGKFTAG